MASFSSEDSVVLFGASTAGVKTKNALDKKNVAVNCFCDNDKSKWGTKVDGVNVISVNELTSMSNSTPIVISSMYDQEIKTQLNQLGFTNIKTADSL